MMHLIGLALAIFAGLWLFAWSERARERRAIRREAAALVRPQPELANPNPPGDYDPKARWAPGIG